MRTYRIKGLLLGALAAIAALPAAADATLFTLAYTTFDDGIHAPVTVNAQLDASVDPFTPGGYVVDGITGTRGNVAITGISDPFSEIYVPAAILPGYQFPTFVDSFGFTFTAGGSDYEVYRDSTDTTFYHELQDPNDPNGNSTGRLILPASFSLAAAVPEPGSWMTMLAGFGVVGLGLRRRRMLAHG